MNYNQILKNRVIALLTNKKFDNCPLEVKKCYIHSSRDIKIINVREIFNEIRCIDNALSNIIWNTNYNITITHNDLYLLNGYIPKKFKDELLSPEYIFLNRNKLDFYKNLGKKELLLNLSKVIIRIKENNLGIHIGDGYHRVFSALSKQDSITFRCIVGLPKN